MQGPKWILLLGTGELNRKHIFLMFGPEISRFAWVREVRQMASYNPFSLFVWVWLVREMAFYKFKIS